ncbi:DNA-binding response regulator [Thalassotalea insulae]|uniref:DNA-binding response regulator n=1 Tax=Thalassotalea insulae TaxID=2056778 RepID=A0ABQ6H078_9GAMM|nr:response regulator [Thalassotalea insulae]GLX79866.1 DNA-binding response regulator [Thalassotalea insulae]
MKLLIVEDDSAFANVLKRRLEKHQFSCWHVEHANEALIACRRYLPDYILLDMKLHDDSGLSLIKPMRQLLPDARIILLTGYASIASAVDAIKLGADDYLSKPVDSQTLLAALNNTKVAQQDFEPLEEKPLSAEQVEWQHIQQVLKYNNGNISATARQLAMHRRTLQRKLQKMAPLVNESSVLT